MVGMPVVMGWPQLVHCTGANREKAKKYAHGSITMSAKYKTSRHSPPIIRRASAKWSQLEAGDGSRTTASAPSRMRLHQSSSGTSGVKTVT